MKFSWIIGCLHFLFSSILASATKESGDLMHLMNKMKLKKSNLFSSYYSCKDLYSKFRQLPSKSSILDIVRRLRTFFQNLQKSVIYTVKDARDDISPHFSLALASPPIRFYLPAFESILIP
jgi:hypothetical protein